MNGYSNGQHESDDAVAGARDALVAEAVHEVRIPSEPGDADSPSVAGVELHSGLGLEGPCPSFDLRSKAGPCAGSDSYDVPDRADQRHW